MTSLAQRTAADTRDDNDAVARIADLTRLSERTVRSRLREAGGGMYVRRVFEDRWPSTPEQLGELTVAFAKAYELHREIRRVTGATRTLVSRRLNATHGKSLVRNVFWDFWPDENDERRGRVTASAVVDVDDDLDQSPDDESSDVGSGDLDSVSKEPREIGLGTLLSNRYELKTVLGIGGFGTTYTAYDRLTKLELVVKVPNVDDGGAVQRELRHAFRLLHPNICQAFPDQDDDSGKPFLVLQYGGDDLGQRLARTADEPFPVPLAVHVLSSIADALDYLHDKLVIHLDVSPGNVLIDEHDVVRLTDFGASSSAREHVGQDGARTIMATTVSAMTSAYAAPEVFHREGRSKSDQYSLAMVFCSLLEGRVFQQRYRPRTFPKLSAKQNQAIAKALSHHPEDRFESCGEFAREVADELGRVPPQVLAADLDVLSRDLLHRFERELASHDRGASRLGGVVLLGRGLEHFLHATALWMGAVDNFDAEQVLKDVDPKSSGLARATAGRIAKTIMKRGVDGAAAAPQVATLVADLHAEDSRVWKLMNFRNEIVHGQRPPEAIVGPARDVEALLREHRRVAGWG